MKTYKQVERALANAERRVDEWQGKLDDMLINEYCAVVKDGTAENGCRLAPLTEAFYSAWDYNSEEEPLKMSNVAYALARYCGQIYSVENFAVVRTQTALNRIAKAENKLNNWNAIRYWLETLLDNIDEHGNARLYCEETYAEAVHELNKLGFSA